MYPQHQRQGQQTPIKGKPQADPPLELEGIAAIIPKGDTAHLFVKKAHEIFRSRCQQASRRGEQPHPLRHPRRKSEDERCTQSVDRAERQEQHRPPSGNGAPLPPSICQFQSVPHSAVEQNIPNQSHFSSPFCSLYKKDRNHARKELQNVFSCDRMRYSNEYTVPKGGMNRCSA